MPAVRTMAPVTPTDSELGSPPPSEPSITDSVLAEGMAVAGSILVASLQNPAPPPPQSSPSAWPPAGAASKLKEKLRAFQRTNVGVRSGDVPAPKQSYYSAVGGPEKAPSGRRDEVRLSADGSVGSSAGSRAGGAFGASAAECGAGTTGGGGGGGADGPGGFMPGEYAALAAELEELKTRPMRTMVSFTRLGLRILSARNSHNPTSYSFY